MAVVTGPAADLGWWLTGRPRPRDPVLLARRASRDRSLVTMTRPTTPARCPPAASRTGVPPDRLEITKLAVDPQMSNNCYLLRCTDTGDQVLIDAADEPERLLELIGDGGLTTVVTTHQHWDHHRALPAVVQATGAVVVAGEPDADAITEQTGVTVDHRVGEDDRIAVGTCSLAVIPVAGHTPGLDLPAVRRRGPAARTSSPATRCSPAASATPRTTPTASPS